jgi:TonB family protein
MKKLLFIIFFLICLSGYSQTFKEVIGFWGSGLPKIEVIKNLDLKKIAENQYNKFGEVIVKKNYDPVTGLLDGVFFNEDFEGTYNQGALNCNNCKLYLKAKAKRYSSHEDAFYIGNVVNGFLDGEFTVAKEKETYSSREWSFNERARIISLLGPTDAADYFIVYPKYSYRSGTEINKIASLNYKKNNLIGNQLFYDNNGKKIVEINFGDQDIIGFISYNEENKSIVKDSIVNDSKIWKVDNKYIINDKSEQAIRKVLDILEDDYEGILQLISNFNSIVIYEYGIRSITTIVDLIEKANANANKSKDLIKAENIVDIVVEDDFDDDFDVPIFPGCESVAKSQRRVCFQEQMNKHIRKNFRYPDIAREMGIQGIVYVNFIISKDGTITNIRMRGPDKNLENEAARIIGRLPQMTPGRQRGRPVRVPYSIPITFRF